MTLRISIAALVLTSLALAGQAAAGAPEPSAKVPREVMNGRWYEVARFPNPMQKGCFAGTSDWTPTGAGFQVVQACRRGAPKARATVWKARASVVDRETNAKFRMSFFGGMLKQEYWVLDAKPEQGWVLLGTPGGNFLWLMAQRPTLAPPIQAQALARVRQLGYDVSRLEFPRPAAE